MGRGELERLSQEELIELVLRLQRPEKTSRTSSKPPSTDRKEQREKSKWTEQPMYFQLAFAIDRVKALAPQHPEWKTKQLFASLLKGDVKGALTGGERAMLTIVMATHAGITTGEFEKIVTDGIATAKHPKSGRLYTEM